VTTFHQYLTDKYLFNCLTSLCHITDNMKLAVNWYSKAGTMQGAHLFAVPNVTVHPSMASVPIIILPAY